MNVLELSEQEIIRRNSLNELRAMGIEPYPAAEYVTNAFSTDISLQDSGLRKHLQKLRYMERLLSLLHQQTRHFHIFQTAQILIFQRILTMYISVRTTQFTEQSIRHYLTLRVIFLYQMFHHASYQNLWM